MTRLSPFSVKDHSAKFPAATGALAITCVCLITLPVTVNSSDFASIDLSLLTAPRQPDGSLPHNDLMRLLPSSDCINKGTNVGVPYHGSAPDLGCFESDVK